MSKFSYIILMLVAFTIHPSYAADIEVNWLHPEKYTDVRPSNENRAKFRQRVMTELEKQFVQSAAGRLADYRIKITVTDVDLAGDIDMLVRGSIDQIRVIKSIYRPKISLSYQIVNPQDEMVKQGEAQLKDMSFMDKPRRLKYAHGGFEYEKQLIDEWLTKLLNQLEPAK